MPMTLWGLAALLWGLAAPLQVSPDPGWTGAFRRTSGWTGADACYSVPVGEGRTLWLFGDTFDGAILPDGRRDPGSRFLHNSAALQDGSGPERIRFFTEPLFEPPDGRGFFWPLDGFSPAPGRALVFLGQFELSGALNGLGFRQVGSWLAEVALMDGPQGLRPRTVGLRPLPSFSIEPGGAARTYGAALTEEGPWVYIHGVRDAGGLKELLTARAPRGGVADPGQWRFFDGQGWARDPSAAAPRVGGVSNELSIHRQGEGFVLVSGGAGLEPVVRARTAPTPVGPWSDPILEWVPPEAGPGVLVYNAKAHPEVQPSGQGGPEGLLVSYNVNAAEPQRVLEEGDLYRPRFVRLRGGLEAPPPNLSPARRDP